MIVSTTDCLVGVDVVCDWLVVKRLPGALALAATGVQPSGSVGAQNNPVQMLPG